MKKQKTAPAESAVQTEKKGTGIQIDKKTVFGITALLLVIMLLAGVLTQVVPRGEYQMDDSGMVINGTYHEFAGDEGKMPWWKIILAPIMVFTSSQITTGIGIVVFIVLIGGTFLILDRSGVLKYIMSSVVRKFEKKKYLLLAVIVFVCMMMSSVVGVLEESLTLVPLAVAISLALGWDSFVGLGISMVSIAFGYTAATFNPFNVGILQTMADLPLFSGLAYRVLFFVCVYASLVLFLIVYAKKIEKNPEKSLCYESDKELRGRHVVVIEDILDTGHTLDFLKKHLLQKEPASLRFCILLDKPERREVDFQADYVGFTIPNEFVVGYGLDYNEHYRNLPYVGVLKSEIYSK